MEQGENLYEVRALLTTRADRLARRGSGRRSKTRSATRRGRAVGDRIPRGKAEDLAVGATLRAAAPYQWSRGGGQSGLVILPPDLRVKVRESRVGADIVFAVDASGSMGAARRMKEVKEAVLSMLMDSYQKRDQVGLVAFRGGEAAAVLELTRSVELAQRELRPSPPAADPLAAGLEEAAACWSGSAAGCGIPAPAGAHHRRPGQFQPGRRPGGGGPVGRPAGGGGPHPSGGDRHRAAVCLSGAGGSGGPGDGCALLPGGGAAGQAAGPAGARPQPGGGLRRRLW
ncbi:MAG: VWA domain-containing protein [Flavonifractor plautii]